MSLFKTLRSWWGSTGDATVQKVDTTQIDLEVPRYPPFVKGLPAVAPERLIQSQDELLVQLARVVTVSKPLYEQHYLGVLRRFVSYCHLLPASQAHHHRGAGACFVTRSRSACGRRRLATSCFWILERRQPSADKLSLDGSSRRLLLACAMTWANQLST